MGPESNTQMTTFLSRRTCLILVTAAGKHKFGTYMPDDCVTFLGRGTGVLLAHGHRDFIATNDHVIQMHKCAELCTTVHIGIENQKPFSEHHDGYAFAAREFVDDGTGCAKLDDHGCPIPKDPLTDTDLALVSLSPSSSKAARTDGRQFVEWSSVPTCMPDAGTRVCFRGYPKENVDFVRELRSFGVDGFSLFTSVLRVEGNRIVIDAKESEVFAGVGSAKPQRDLHGISGSGLFDEEGTLVGIIYGGDPDAKEIFACKASALAPLLDELA